MKWPRSIQCHGFYSSAAVQKQLSHSIVTFIAGTMERCPIHVVYGIYPGPVLQQQLSYSIVTVIAGEMQRCLLQVVYRIHHSTLM